MQKKLNILLSFAFIASLSACGGQETDSSSQRSATVYGSCEGHCGAQSPGGCWCDASCELYGDCCVDKVEQCESTSSQDPDAKPCYGVCSYGAHCTDYCPPGASCIKVVDETPSYWKVLGCGWSF
jgi:hypothetical protein